MKRNRKPTVNKREAKNVDEVERSVTHSSFKLSALPKIDNSGLPSSFTLLWQTITDTYKYRWRTFFLVLSYGIIWYGFVLTDPNSVASGIFGINISIIASLASIWIIRHREAGDRVTIRGAYYKGMVQLVPFILVSMVLALQLTPGYIGFAVFDTATKSGAVVTALEYMVPLLIWLFSLSVSMYWATAGVMSLYIATIPGTLPMQALRAGKKLVDGRRWFIFRRFIIGGVFVTAMYLGIGYGLAQLKLDEVVAQLSTLFPIIIIPALHTYVFKIYSSLIEKIQ